MTEETKAGRLSAAQQARVERLPGMIERARASLRYVDYRQAEQDCEVLAAKILRHFARSELERFSFTAIPRGGLIVLGMLAYCLDLRAEQLAPESPEGRSLFIVDDCALTGARLAAALDRAASREVVVAHLYSHPELRAAVLAREPQVKQCLAAHDLSELAQATPAGPEERAAWVTARQELLGTERYWWGQPEAICFAWSEPDRPFWNPATEKLEDGWRFLPPHQCLKNRMRLLGEPQDTRRELWRVPPDVVSGEFEGIVWLCHTKTGSVYSLDASAAAMWRLLAGNVAPESAIDQLAAMYAIDKETIRGDMEKFAARLVAEGMLERCG